MAKKHYRVRNWSEYNRALINRCNINFWFDEVSIAGWYHSTQNDKRGRAPTYSDMAIVCGLTLRAVFRLSLRSAQGLIGGLIQRLDLPIICPHYSTLNRRQAGLEIRLPRTHKDEAIHVVFDSTGLKVYGEGEWKVRQHGYTYRRTWRKLSIMMDVDNQELVSAILSTADCHDSEMLPDLVEAVAEPIADAIGDGGYDSHVTIDLLQSQGATPLIPVRKGAKVRQRIQRQVPPLARDTLLRQQRVQGRQAWKKAVHYHRRSKVETAMYRLKQLFGDKLANRCFDHQVTEAYVRCRALNLMTQLGMPNSVAIS